MGYHHRESPNHSDQKADEPKSESHLPNWNAQHSFAQRGPEVLPHADDRPNAVSKPPKPDPNPRLTNAPLVPVAHLTNECSAH